MDRLKMFYQKNSFLINVGLAILAALAYPPLGVKYLYPEITSDWIAVVCIFIISGLSLKTKEILQAMK